MDPAIIGERLQSEIDDLVTKNRDIFSAVLGVSSAQGEFYWSGAAGFAHADGSQVMEVDTPIFIASVTKMYTAAATMILEERELLSLDDPISKFLPESLVEGLHVYQGHDYSNQLAIYHLISQTSGLPDYFMERPEGRKSIYDRILAEGDFEWNVDQVVDIAKNNLSPKFPPLPLAQKSSSKKAYYADTNYQLLGAVIESVTQKSLHAAFSELILEPLELLSTYMHGYAKQSATNEYPPANIYHKTKPYNLDKAMTSFGPDGGMVSNVQDSLKFLKYFMEGKLFALPSTLERMKSWRKMFYPFQYGLGLMRFKLPRILTLFSPSPELIGHAGASSAFLFYSDIGQLYIAGTLNQLENQRRPFQLMLKVVNILIENSS